MKNKLRIQQFIEQNPDWEQKLQEKPYCITISRDMMFGRKLVMFKYSQIESDFHSELVRECRGLILDENTLEPVCVPFFKFGNYGESYCPKIDWTSCWVGEKLDGSLIKIVKLGSELLVSTNGTIDAFKAPLAEQIGCTAKTFGDLVIEALDNALAEWSANQTVQKDWIIDGKTWLLSTLEEGKTYMFELTSPFNKVVVSWHETRLNFLGVRDNKSLQETYFSDHMLKSCFKTPKVFPLGNIDECVKAAEQLDCNNEGFVVCDKWFNRVKVKSPTYVALHHMRNNGILSYERGVEIVRGNELGEVLSYFPEFKEHLESIKEKYDRYAADLNSAQEQIIEWIKSNGYDRQKWFIQSGGQKRKDYAIFVMKSFKLFSAFAFAFVDEKVMSAEEWLADMPTKNLAAALGLKDKPA